MRYLSFAFHGLLSLVLVAISALALATAPSALHLPMLPWTGSTLTYVVFFASLFGLITVLLAIAHKLRVLFFLWSVVVFVFLVKGYFFSSYRFVSGSLSTALILIALAIVALPGAWLQLREPASKRVF
jgi:hypothetical protein